MHVYKYLPLLICVLCYIICLIVVSVCITANLRHWVGLVLLFGSVYITVLNCICYVTFIWWFVFYYIHCPAWQILCNPAFVLHNKLKKHYETAYRGYRLLVPRTVHRYPALQHCACLPRSHSLVPMLSHLTYLFNMFSFYPFGISHLRP